MQKTPTAILNGRPRRTFRKKKKDGQESKLYINYSPNHLGIKAKSQKKNKTNLRDYRMLTLSLSLHGECSDTAARN